MDVQDTHAESVADPAARPRLKLVDADGDVLVDPSPDDVRRRLESETFFWLDLHSATQEGLDLVREVFEFHPLALEDSEVFGQRPKVDLYDDFAFVVVYGSTPDADGLVEVHCFSSQNYLVTVHRDDCPAFTELHRRYMKRNEPLAGGAMLLYQVVDALVDSFFPALEELDERIDTLEDEIFSHPDERQLQEIFSMKRRLIDLRRVISPQRDMLSQVVSGSTELPGIDAETSRYFRDAEDHLIRLSEMINTYRDLLTSMVDAYLSTVANRRDQVVKQLTVLATVFLPITFLTGYFGQNFGYMVNDLIGSRAAFIAGTLFEALVVVGILAFFKLRGWI
jgi:magnesium transporter